MLASLGFNGSNATQGQEVGRARAERLGEECPDGRGRVTVAGEEAGGGCGGIRHYIGRRVGCKNGEKRQQTKVETGGQISPRVSSSCRNRVDKEWKL